MPYTRKQCGLFGAMEGRGEKTPQDWHAHCKKGQTKPEKRKKGIINRAMKH